MKHPPITIFLVASLNCAECNEPVQTERLMGAGEEPKASHGYTKGDLIAEYSAHLKREHGASES